MPKKPSEKVVTYRIEFQESERQILKDFVTGQNVGEVSQLFEGIDKLFTFENLYIGATIFEIITGKEILFGTPNDLTDLLGQLKDASQTILSEGNAAAVDLVGIATDPTTYTSATIRGLREIFGLN